MVSVEQGESAGSVFDFLEPPFDADTHTGNNRCAVHFVNAKTMRQPTSFRARMNFVLKCTTISNHAAFYLANGAECVEAIRGRLRSCDFQHHRVRVTSYGMLCVRAWCLLCVWNPTRYADGSPRVELYRRVMRCACSSALLSRRHECMFE